MQHLNYCRQLLIQISEEGADARCDRDKADDLNKEFGLAIGTIKRAVKFHLPHGGAIIDDIELRALSSVEDVDIPFEDVAIEFSCRYEATDGSALYTKAIIAMSSFDGMPIIVHAFHYESNRKRWIFTPAIFFPKDASKLSIGKKHGLLEGISHSALLAEYIKKHPGQIDWVSNILHAVTSFLNALACKNVHIEKSPAKSTKQGKKVKTALPFDDYHFLTVDVPGKAGTRGEGFGGSHRSPREHLRRGHIRRLDSGPIWVNACVVNAGIGSKVGKSYLLRKSE